MEPLAVRLPGPVTLMPSKNLDANVRRKVRDHHNLPIDPGRWAADLNRLAAGVPATMSEPRQNRGWSLVLHAETYVLRLYPTKSQDAYWISDVHPLRAHNLHQLAQGSLLLFAAGWGVAATGRHVPPSSSAHWPVVTGAWQHLSEHRAAESAQGQVARTNSAHRAFLDRVDQVIEATERITTAEESSPYPYGRVKPIGEKRSGAQQIYQFRLAGARVPDEGAFVRLRGEPDYRGQVTIVEGAIVTVRFDAPVDYGRLNRPGELEVTPSKVVFDKEREAVSLIRTGQSRNPHLLSAFVDHRLRPLYPGAATPEEPLDHDQLAAFRAALTVEDLMLVLGPPGTGKTRVISQVARSCTHAGQRVLVTSHTHRAVDNVLSRLPRGILAVRVGNEGKVTAEGRPYLLEKQAAELRTEILATVDRSLTAYATLEHFQRWADELAKRLDLWSKALAGETRTAAELAAARRAAGGPAQARVDQLTAHQESLASSIERSRSAAAALAGRRQRHMTRAAWPVIGAIFAALARRLDRRVTTLSEQEAQWRSAMGQADRELADAATALDVATRDVPGVRAALEALEQETARRDKAMSSTLTAARAAIGAVAALGPAPTVSDSDPAVTWHEASGLLSWLRERLPRLIARHRLLTDWRSEVSGPSDVLHAEMILYADVIAATCIGAASRPELADVDFDLAIVDEAGQIGLPDVLVPLVRARRGVLVGDHKQLPPYLDSDVDAWGRQLGDPAVRDLIATSAFEALADQLSEGHVLPLKLQRRMPSDIAEFISTSFYDGWLDTDVERDEPDLLFDHALTFVDTARLPPPRRCEKDVGRASERWGLRGYTNPAEGALLTELAAFYHRQHAEWAVILPYRAQVIAVTAALVAELGDTDSVSLNVGTVDSFQGGERDIILYGFTRSNPGGAVGFLKELRRANVAFTRAKHRLILIGDSTTLTRAKDPGFRSLAKSLRTHVASRGELADYEDVRRRLAGVRNKVGGG